MKVRKAKKSDYKELMSLYDVFLGPRRFLKKGNDSFLRFIKNPKCFLFVAEDKGKIVGFISFQARYVIRHRLPIGQIEELFVAKNFRHAGVGKKLIQQAEKTAKIFKCDGIYVESGNQHRPAHGFYQNLGYKKSGYYFKK